VGFEKKWKQPFKKNNNNNKKKKKIKKKLNLWALERSWSAGGGIWAGWNLRKVSRINYKIFNTIYRFCMSFWKIKTTIQKKKKKKKKIEFMDVRAKLIGRWTGSYLFVPIAWAVQAFASPLVSDEHSAALEFMITDEVSGGKTAFNSFLSNMLK